MAVALAGVDDEGVKFVEELMVGRQRGFESGAELFVGGFGMGEGVAFQNTAGVGVDDEHRVLACVEQNGIGSLRPDTAHTQQLCAKSSGRRCEKPGEGTGVLCVQ